MDKKENENIFIPLRSQSTWRLVILSFITLGIYLGHYVLKQTKCFNRNVNAREQLPPELASIYFSLIYLSFFSTLMYIFLLEENHPVSIAIDIIDFTIAIIAVIWAFMFRSRAHRILQIRSDNDVWFHGIWTFLFTTFYVNFKINQLTEENLEK